MGKDQPDNDRSHIKVGAREADLPVNVLRELLDYDACTGEFTWRARSGFAPKTVQWNKRFAGKPAGHTDLRGYRRLKILCQVHFAHRAAWAYVFGAWPNTIVDHIDGNKSNNRIQNLRDAGKNVNAQNLRGARKDSSSGILGAHPRKGSSPWASSIQVDGKMRHLGVFSTAEEAGAAYLAAKRKLHPGCTL